MVPHVDNHRILDSCLLPPMKTRTSRKQKQQQQQKVRFGSVNVRFYERTVGDNPCAYGPPLALSWKYTTIHFQSIKAYQHLRKEERRRTFIDTFGRRVYHPLSYNERTTILQQWGFSEAQLKTVMRQMERIQSQRSQSKLFYSTAYRLEQKLKQPAINMKNRSVLKRANKNNKDGGSATKNVTASTTPIKLPQMHKEHQLLSKLHVKTAMIADEFAC